MLKKLLIIVLVFLVFGLAFINKEIIKAQGEDGMDLKSNAFKKEGTIPEKFTCEGADISPALSWQDVPEEAESLALIADDPDAPMGTWVHWVIFNIPTGTTELREGIPAKKKLDNGSIQGRNDFKKIGYGGPCPPPGSAHRYYFKLYALDERLDLPSGVTKSELKEAMEGHIIGKAELMGKYSR